MSTLATTTLVKAAEITGMIQQTLERLHAFRTYELSSAASLRHAKLLNDVQKSLADVRNHMAAFSLVLGKEGG